MVDPLEARFRESQGRIGQRSVSRAEFRLDGGGLRAFEEPGNELPSHQAFWFAWSQFHPDTAVWSE